MQRAWYKSQVAKYFLFDEAPLLVAGDEVPVSPIYDGFTINPGEPNGEVEFHTEPNSKQRHNVVAKERPEDVERKKACPTGRAYSVLMRMARCFEISYGTS